MGFSNTAPTSATYFTFSDGMCRIRLKEKTPESISRVTKEGNTVHEIVHEQFTGTIKSCLIADSDFGKQWRLVFQDGISDYVLTLKYSSNYAKTLVQALCNPEWDATVETTIRPYSFSPKDDPTRTFTGCTISQRGKKIERLYCSPVNPVDGKTLLPDLEKVKVRGVEVWDDTKQMEFLVSEFEAKVTPKLANKPVTAETMPFVQKGNSDELPF